MSKRWFRHQAMWLIIASGIAGAITLGEFRNAVVTTIGTTLHLPEIALRLNRDPYRAFRIGNFYFNGGAYELLTARGAYRSALALDPHTRLAHFQLSRIHFIRGELGSAMREVELEMRLHPENHHAWYLRGLIRGYLHDYSGAETDFIRFVELVPEQWAGYNDLAWIQVRQEKFAEAVATIQKGFLAIPGIEERNPWLWTSRGVAELNLGAYDKARISFGTALRLSDEMTPERFWSAYPGNDSRNAEGAFRDFRAALFFNAAIAAEKSGDYTAARQAYETYLSLAPAGTVPTREKIEAKIRTLDTRASESH